MIFVPAPFLIAKIAQIVGAPISDAAIFAATVLFAVLFLVPSILGWGARIPYVAWNRAGLVLAVLYLLAATFAHHVALQRTIDFAKRENIEVQSLGALPLPPSLWRWDGLVLAPRGVYEIRLDLSDELFSQGVSNSAQSDSAAEVLQHKYYPDAPPSRFIDQARSLPEVQKVLWFARFPVTRFHPEGTDAVVEFSDLRFPQIRPDRPASFTYRVRFSADGTVLSQGWVKP